ncbi:MAG TPA: thiolase family protein, partial [Actinomycetota bacterium]|nr:thiolase family protein [Actinomycetota bacterium]
LGRYNGALVPQGISAELIAADFDLTREQLDDLGFRSHQRAAAATTAGHFRNETFPIKLESELFEIDEGIRFNSDRAKMGNLPTPFFSDDMAKQFPEIRWVVTAGNSSQISDGAAALLIMTPEKAKALGLTPRARFTSFAIAGGDPIRMLLEPIPATRKALERAGLGLADIDVIEINEAFASVVLAWKKALGIDDEYFEERVNPNGGAIALGHPLGSSGARLMTTLLNELERRGARYGLQTMCEGGGMANATVIERLG